MRLLVITIALLSSTAGCRRFRRDEPAGAALAVVEAARSPAGIAPEQVDAELVERARRIQLALRASWDTHDRDRLLAAFSGDWGPDRQYPPAERPLRQRERASRGLREGLAGRCRAERWDLARDRRVRWLTAPLDPSFWPKEIARAQAALAQDLAHAEAARVRCDGGGDVVMLLARRDGGPLRLVDVVPTVQSNVQLNPNDPHQR